MANGGVCSLLAFGSIGMLEVIRAGDEGAGRMRGEEGREVEWG